MKPTNEAPAPLRHTRAIALLGVAQVMTLVAGLVRWKVIAILLGPIGVGIVGLLDQIAQVILQVGSMSLPTVALRFLGKAHHDDTGLFGRLYRGFLVAVLTGGLGTAVVALAVFMFRPTSFGIGIEAYRVPLAIALLTVPLTGAANLTRNALATLGRHRDAALAMAVSAIGLAVAALLGVRWGGIPGLYAATLVASALIAIFLDRAVMRDPFARSDGAAVRPLAFLRAQPGVLRFSATLCVVGFTVPLSYTVLRSSVLSELGPAAAGFLAAALTVGTGARGVFTQTSSQFLMPRASRDAPKAHRTAEVGGYLRTLVVAMLIAALPVALFPGEILRILFSVQFLPAAAFLGVFVLGELMLAFGDAYRILLLGFDDLRGYLATTIAAPALVMLGASFVVTHFGILGLGLLHLSAAVLGLAVSQLRLRREHGAVMPGELIGFYAMMIALVGLATMLGAMTPDPSIRAWAWKLAVGLLFATVGIRMLPAGERQALLRTLPSRRGRGTPRA